MSGDRWDALGGLWVNSQRAWIVDSRQWNAVQWRSPGRSGTEEWNAKQEAWTRSGDEWRGFASEWAPAADSWQSLGKTWTRANADWQPLSNPSWTTSAALDGARLATAGGWVGTEAIWAGARLLWTAPSEGVCPADFRSK